MGLNGFCWFCIKSSHHFNTSFFKKTKKTTVCITLELRIMASFPSSFRISFIASFIEGARYFFTFTQHSPPQHFELQHLLRAHYKIILESVENTVLLIDEHTFLQRVNKEQLVFAPAKKVVPLV